VIRHHIAGVSRTRPCSLVDALLHSEHVALSLEIVPNVGVTHRPLAFPCVSLCEKPLRRPHITCIHCHIRKVWYGDRVNKVIVKPYIVFLRELGPVKYQFRKLFLSLAECMNNS